MDVRRASTAFVSAAFPVGVLAEGLATGAAGVLADGGAAFTEIALGVVVMLFTEPARAGVAVVGLLAAAAVTGAFAAGGGALEGAGSSSLAGDILSTRTKIP
jgi:hypothetical protein